MPGQYPISAVVFSTRLLWKTGRRDRRNMMREGNRRAGTGTSTRVMAVRVRACRPAAADVPTSAPEDVEQWMEEVVVVVVVAVMSTKPATMASDCSKESAKLHTKQKQHNDLKALPSLVYTLTPSNASFRRMSSILATPALATAMNGTVPCTSARVLRQDVTN